MPYCIKNYALDLPLSVTDKFISTPLLWIDKEYIKSNGKVKQLKVLNEEFKKFKAGTNEQIERYRDNLTSQINIDNSVKNMVFTSKEGIDLNGIDYKPFRYCSAWTITLENNKKFQVAGDYMGFILYHLRFNYSGKHVLRDKTLCFVNNNKIIAMLGIYFNYQNINKD